MREKDKKRFLLRLDPRLYRVLEKWAQDELRSVNAQIEYLLKEAAKKAGRWKDEAPPEEGREP
ncbi:type II toxin-antitoxin system antitoxin [Thermus antranikianii]|uniref:hypothetical protein n=1 Tax=Thermus antranikianii TaxID=88190 RepID=UPI001C77381C|nr:hypothetical protein [Thermus antranikianii]QWK22635.1 MAG: hypothetical protein KNN15_03995 [Thermus antranikianii]